MSPKVDYHLQTFLIIPQPSPKEQPQRAGLRERKPCLSQSHCTTHTWHLLPQPLSWLPTFLLFHTQLLHACAHRHTVHRPLHIACALHLCSRAEYEHTHFISLDFLWPPVPEPTLIEANRASQICHHPRTYSKMTLCPSVVALLVSTVASNRVNVRSNFVKFSVP